MFRAGRVVHVNQRRREEKLPAVPHGVARVQGEIHDDLVQIAGIRKDRRQVVTELKVERDVLPDEAAQHRYRLLDRCVNRKRTPLNDLLPAVSEQLLCQCRGALGCADHLMERCAQLFIQLCVSELQRSVSENDGQDVIEIVSDARCEASHALHLLRLP